MFRLLLKITAIVLLFAVNRLTAQDLTGKAVYKSKTTVQNFQMKINGREADPTEMQNLKDKMNKMNEKTYLLDFNRYESVFDQQQELAPPAAGSGNQVVRVVNSDDGKLYKNLKTKKRISEKDFFGKEFLLTDSLPAYNWQLLPDTKVIGGYTCYKAEHVIPVSEQQLKEYEQALQKKNDDATQFMVVNEPKERKFVAWYTPEIPVSHGPAELYGLPGLILEASYDNTVMLCTKIILNPKDKVQIKVPKKEKQCRPPNLTR